MVLRHRKPKMASEQPVKKKLRRTADNETTDETDYIDNLAETGMRNELSALHLSLPANVNEADITRNGINTQFSNSALIATRQFYSSNNHSTNEKTTNVNGAQLVVNNSSVLNNGVYAAQTRTACVPKNTSGNSSNLISYNTSLQNVSIEPAPNISTANVSFTHPYLNTYVPTTYSTNSTISYPANSHVSSSSSFNINQATSVYKNVASQDQNTERNFCHTHINKHLCHKSQETEVYLHSQQNQNISCKLHHTSSEQHNCLISQVPNLTQGQAGNTYQVINHNHQTPTSDDTFRHSQLAYSNNKINSTNFASNPESDIDQQIMNNADELEILQRSLIKNCLCDISHSTLRKIIENQFVVSTTESMIKLNEWPVPKLLRFLSTFQLLFDVYLKQNNRGFICTKLVDVCDFIIKNEFQLIEQIIHLCNLRNKYVNFISGRVLSSFFIIAKNDLNHEWLEVLTNFLSTDTIDYDHMNFALETIKRVVEWKDVEIHVLEESQSNQDGAGSSRQSEMGACQTVHYDDAESFDTSPIKGILIKNLESKWPSLISKIQHLIISQDVNIDSQTCIVSFLSLWESTISVRANLSVIDTKPFYAHLENFVVLLNNSLSPLIWKQLLSLFNEVLCYGSTLALQDMLPDDTCKLAHLIVRYVKGYRLLDSLPYRRNEGFTVNGFVGTIPSTEVTQTVVDKTLLQKIVLLVLKSVAVTIKETRSDSSDSSVGSDDYDFYQDMQVIVLSIQDVLRKVDVFIKNSLDFHPETLFPKLLIHLFSDQDDYMIESMVCTLDITVGISYRHTVCPELITMLNPIYSFIEFLKVVSHDPAVLLDYLVSNETCFLLYLLRFLKYIRKNWSKFVSSCQSMGQLSRTDEFEDTMTVLSRLRIQIDRLVSKSLFPYNITPVLKLLIDCENLYEGNEDS